MSKKLKEHQDVGGITDVAVLKINEANKMRELYRVLGEIHETGKEKNVDKKKEVGGECKAMGEISEVNSADQIGQLEASRFKTKSKITIYQARKARKFRKTKCLECGRKFQRGKPTINTATLPGKFKLRQLGITGLLKESLSRESRMGNH